MFVFKDSKVGLLFLYLCKHLGSAGFIVFVFKDSKVGLLFLYLEFESPAKELKDLFQKVD